MLFFSDWTLYECLQTPSTSPICLQEISFNWTHWPGLSLTWSQMRALAKTSYLIYFLNLTTPYSSSNSLTSSINDMTLQGSSSYLSKHFQFVHSAGNTSPSTPVICGVPNLCTRSSAFSSIGCWHQLISTSYQLYLSSTIKMHTQFLQSSTGINKITDWCVTNKLVLNPNETEFLWSTTARCQSQLDYTLIDLSNDNIRPSKAVRDLGFMIDLQLSFAQHLKK